MFTVFKFVSLLKVLLINERIKMKNIITLLIIIAISYTVQAQSVPNGDFEAGSDTLSLNGWHTINELTGIFFPFTRTTDAYSGNYAVKLETLEIFSTLVPGLATLGEISIGDVQGAVHFPYKPDKLTGMYKHPTNKDASLIWVYFLGEQGDTLGQGTFVPEGNIQQYSAFEIEIDYYSDALPDSMNILLISDRELTNSPLYIDNLEFVYTSNSILEKKETPINIYPNPTSSLIHIKTNKSDKTKYKLHNLYGGILESGYINKDLIIDLSGQVVGTYFLVVDNRKYKIIKI